MTTTERSHTEQHGATRTKEAEANRREPGGRAKRRTAHAFLAVEVVGDSVYATRRNGDEITTGIHFEAGSTAPLESRKLPAFLILPKSDYLVREVELPAVEQDEVRLALELEVETNVPPRYGDVELSYRRLETRDVGTHRFVVYVARRAVLEHQLRVARECGLIVRGVIPTALLWDRFVQRDNAPRLFVAADDGGMEVASYRQEEGLHLRSFQSHTTADNDTQLHPRFVDYVRSLLAKPHWNAPLTVEWMGAGCPQINGQSTIRTVLCQTLPPSHAEVASRPVLHIAAQTIPGLADDTIAKANLLPIAMQKAAGRSRVIRNFAVSGIFVALTVATLLIAMKILILRNERIADELSANIASIRIDGVALERRARDVSTALELNKSRHVLTLIIEALLQATPRGLTYNHVELSSDGSVRLRGQAQSLSMPFLLPSALEESPRFSNALLRDAALTRRANGAATDFRIDCKFVWEPKP